MLSEVEDKEGTGALPTLLWNKVCCKYTKLLLALSQRELSIIAVVFKEYHEALSSSSS